MSSHHASEHATLTTHVKPASVAKKATTKAETKSAKTFASFIFQQLRRYFQGNNLFEISFHHFSYMCIEALSIS